MTEKLEMLSYTSDLYGCRRELALQGLGISQGSGDCITHTHTYTQTLRVPEHCSKLRVRVCMCVCWGQSSGLGTRLLCHSVALACHTLWFGGCKVCCKDLPGWCGWTCAPWGVLCRAVPSVGI